MSEVETIRMMSPVELNSVVLAIFRTLSDLDPSVEESLVTWATRFEQLLVAAEEQRLGLPPIEADPRYEPPTSTINDEPLPLLEWREPKGYA